ncbi:hypothetical protein BJP40_02650 [Streptomyces sp. CC53]|nr:hypothetical protein BJP40_02650 [Streptomyces sp. CC53]
MNGWLPYGLSGPVLLGAGALAVAAVCLVLGAVRLGRVRRPRPPAVVRPAVGVEGLAWVACHSPSCGHLQTQHLEVAPGRWECVGCGTVRAPA